MIRAALIATILCCIGTASALLAQPIQPVNKKHEALEQRAAHLRATGQTDAYEKALFDILIHLRNSADAQRFHIAKALVPLAGFVLDYRGDLDTTHLLLSQAIPILETDLGPGHIETLRARAEWIYVKRIEIETEGSWRRTGRAPKFWDGTEPDKIPSDADIDVMGQLAALERRYSPAPDAVTATMNYVSTLLRANRYHDAIAILTDALNRRAAAQKDGQPQNPGTDFMLVQSLGSALISNGRYDLAAQVFRDGYDTVLAMMGQALWAGAKGDADHAYLAGQLFGQTYAMAAWRAAQAVPKAQQHPYMEMAFEAMQLAANGPATAAVARASLRDKGPVPVSAAHIPEPVSLAHSQARVIGPDEALISIMPGTAQSGQADAFNGLVFAATREGAVFVELPLIWDQLVFDIMQLHLALDPGGGGTRAPMASLQGTPGGTTPRLNAPFDFGSAHRLHQAFFAAPEIAALIGRKSVWTVVPLGATLSVPFPALVIEDRADPLQNMRSASDLRSVRWLGHERALNVVPSVAALSDLRQRTQDNGARYAQAYIGFGDPSFQGTGTQDLPTADVILRRSASERAAAVGSLPRLPGTRREVQALAQVFEKGSSLVFLDAQATEAQVRRLNESGALREVGVVHFATHGLLSGAFDGLSEPALALSPQPDTRDMSGDGLLTASEAARLDIDADWVILSACDTAGNDSISGDGLGGLVQGFFSAGARNMLVSHWRVDDQAAERLITHTVTNAQTDGIGKAEALRQAMTSLAADTSRDATGLSFAHPSLWAPFLMIGGG